MVKEPHLGGVLLRSSEVLQLGLQVGPLSDQAHLYLCHGFS